jgi:hypothetical protein
MTQWLPMSEFDQAKPALVHDQLNDKETVRYLVHYRQYATLDFDPEKGLVEWDGLLLEGWKEHNPPSMPGATLG